MRDKLAISALFLMLVINCILIFQVRVAWQNLSQSLKLNAVLVDMLQKADAVGNK